MTDLENSNNDAEAIRNSLAAFFRMADEAPIEALSDYFTSDAVWSMIGVDWTGREAIIEGLLSMRKAGHAGPEVGTRHIITNIEIAVKGGTSEVRSNYLLIAPGSPAAILNVGSYQDQYIRESDGIWRIAKRAVTSFG